MEVSDALGVSMGMMGRGEFGFLIAVLARQGELLSERYYASALWGVILPTVVTPFILPYVLRWRRARLSASEAADQAGEEQT